MAKKATTSDFLHQWRVELDAVGLDEFSQAAKNMQAEMLKVSKTMVASGGTWEGVARIYAQKARDAKAGFANVGGEIKKLHQEIKNGIGYSKAMGDAYEKALSKTGKSVENFSKKVHGAGNSVRKLIPAIADVASVTGWAKLANQLDDYNKNLLVTINRMSKYGTGATEVSSRIKQVGDTIGVTQREAVELFQTFEKGFLTINKSNFTSVMVNLRAAVGSNVAEMKNMAGTLTTVIDKYPDLESAIVNASAADKRFLQERMRGLLMTGNLSLQEYRSMQDYIRGGKQRNAIDKQNQQEIDNQVRSMQEFRRVSEIIGLGLAKSVMPVMEKIASYIRDNSTELREMFETMARGGKWAAENLGKIATVLGTIYALSIAMRGATFLRGITTALQMRALSTGAGTAASAAATTGLGGGAAMLRQSAPAGAAALRSAAVMEGAAAPARVGMGAKIAGGAAKFMKAGPAGLILGLGGEAMKSYGESTGSAGMVRGGGLASAGGMALTGAAIGSAIPLIGTAVGAAVGGALGLYFNRDAIFSGGNAGRAQANSEQRASQGQYSGEFAAIRAKAGAGGSAPDISTMSPSQQQDAFRRAKEASKRSAALEEVFEKKATSSGAGQEVIQEHEKMKQLLMDEIDIMNKKMAVAQGPEKEALQNRKDAYGEHIEQIDTAIIKTHEKRDAIAQTIPGLEAAREAEETTNSILEQQIGQRQKILAMVQSQSELTKSFSSVLDSQIRVMQATRDIDFDTLKQSTIATYAESIKLEKVQRDALRIMQSMTEEQFKSGDLTTQAHQSLREKLGLDEEGYKIYISQNTQLTSQNEMQAEINENVSSRSRELTKITHALDEERGLMSQQVGIMTGMVDLADNFAIGVGASARMRLEAVGMMEKEKNILSEQLSHVQEMLALASERGDKAEILDLEKRRLAINQEQLSLTQKQAGYTKALRDGWISAMSAANTGAGRFTKLIMDQGTNAAQAVRRLGIMQTAVSGGTEGITGNQGITKFSGQGGIHGGTPGGDGTSYQQVGQGQGFESTMYKGVRGAVDFYGSRTGQTAGGMYLGSQTHGMSQGIAMNRATGGIVPGPMGAGDSMLSYLEPGSVVWNRDQQAKVGGRSALEGAYGSGMVEVMLTPGEYVASPGAMINAHGSVAAGHSFFNRVQKKASGGFINRDAIAHDWGKAKDAWSSYVGMFQSGNYDHLAGYGYDKGQKHHASPPSYLRNRLNAQIGSAGGMRAVQGWSGGFSDPEKVIRDIQNDSSLSPSEKNELLQNFQRSMDVSGAVGRTNSAFTRGLDHLRSGGMSTDAGMDMTNAQQQNLMQSFIGTKQSDSSYARSRASEREYLANLPRSGGGGGGAGAPTSSGVSSVGNAGGPGGGGSSGGLQIGQLNLNFKSIQELQNLITQLRRELTRMVGDGNPAAVLNDPGNNGQSSNRPAPA